MGSGTGFYFEENRDILCIKEINAETIDSFSKVSVIFPDRLNIVTSVWEIEVTRRFPFIRFGIIYKPTEAVIREIQNHLQAI